METSDILGWLNQNWWWYFPLHLISGIVGWGIYYYSRCFEFYEEFKDVFQHYGYGALEMDKLFSPQIWFLTILALSISLVGGPLCLLAIALLGISGAIKLRLGIKLL